VQNAILPATRFPTNNDRAVVNGPSARAMVERYANMSKLWNDALEKFLQYFTQDGNNGSSYFFVDVHVSAISAQHVENASNSKMVQYNAAWNQFRSTTRPQETRNVIDWILICDLNCGFSYHFALFRSLYSIREQHI
jgi:hypothetical protein